MPMRLAGEPSGGHISDRAGNRDCTSTCCRFLTRKSLGGGWAQLDLGAFGWGWELGAGWALAGGMGFIKAEANGEGARGPGRGSEPQDGLEPSALGVGILPGQRPNTHQPHSLPIPGQPALSSIDESNPLYYNKLHLPLPVTPTLPHPRPMALTSPSSGGGGCPSSSSATSCQQPGVLALA